MALRSIDPLAVLARALLPALLIALPASVSARTDIDYRGFGFRIGASVNPDQVLIGGQVDLGTFTDRLHFMPNATIGFGDDRTIIALSPDVAYAWPVPDIGALYLGGLFTLQWIRLDLPGGRHDPPLGPGRKRDDSDTELGIHAFTGLALEGNPIFFELHVGLDDAPDLKAVVGYNFLR